MQIMKHGKMHCFHSHAKKSPALVGLKDIMFEIMIHLMNCLLLYKMLYIGSFYLGLRNAKFRLSS